MINTIPEFKQKCKTFLNADEAFAYMVPENVSKEFIIDLMKTYGFDAEGNFKMTPKEAVETIFKEAKR